MTPSAAEATEAEFGPKPAPVTPRAPAHEDETIENAVQDGRVDDVDALSWRDRLPGPVLTVLRVIGTWTLRLGALALGVLVWHLAVATKFNFYINFENVPGPGTVLSSLLVHLSGSKFYTHIGVSMERILIGYALATAVGILLGLAMGRSRLARDLIMPYVEIIRPIPAVAWIPLAILMWPTEESSIIYITFLGALFPIILNTLHGVEQTPEVLVRAARSLGARRTADLPARRAARRAPQHRGGPRHRHGRVLVLAAGRRDHLRPVRHRLFHLERLFADQLSGHRRRYADHRPARHRLHLRRAAGDAAVPQMATEDAMTRALPTMWQAIRARPLGWLAISLGWVVLYYTGLLMALVYQFQEWPNYATLYDWPANIARIFASTPSLSDAIQIARDEWLVEIGYLNTDYGMGISEWSLTLLPAKMLVILAMGMILATIWALNAARTRSCSVGEGGAAVATTGIGAGLVALTNATMTWVVCCAAPSWIVGLTMLGLSTATANWLEPLGLWLKLAGFVLLGATALVMAHRLGKAGPIEAPDRSFDYASPAANAR